MKKILLITLSLLTLNASAEYLQVIKSDNFKAVNTAMFWSDWQASLTNFNCQEWTPNTDTVSEHLFFTQTRECQNENQRSNQYLGEEKKIVNAQESQEVKGTYINTEEYWSQWTATGVYYNCSAWSPSTADVRTAKSFTQSRSCSTDSNRTNIYLGTQTNTTSVSQSQSAVGTRSHNWVYCAAENAACYFNNGESRYVRYGQSGHYTYQIKNNGVACANTAFGDPYQGVVKSCWYDQ